MAKALAQPVPARRRFPAASASRPTAARDRARAAKRDVDSISGNPAGAAASRRRRSSDSCLEGSLGLTLTELRLRSASEAAACADGLIAFENPVEVINKPCPPYPPPGGNCAGRRISFVSPWASSSERAKRVCSLVASAKARSSGKRLLRGNAWRIAQKNLRSLGIPIEERSRGGEQQNVTSPG